MKIIEWNINHRSGNFGGEMPRWVKDVIQEKNADIIVLTEVSFKVPNWDDECRDMFDCEKYQVFCSNNVATGRNVNEVCVAINKEHFSMKNEDSQIIEGYRNSDNLVIHCIHQKTNKKVTIIGMRIHAPVSNPKKRAEFCKILEAAKNDENVIIAGDFNNNWRECECDIWSLGALEKLAKDNGFEVYTPSLGSIYEAVPYKNRKECSFPEDHIMVKGQSIVIEKLYDYDRSFVNKEPRVYKFGNEGKDFQEYLGKDKDGNNQYNRIPILFPDHAILEADFDIV